MKELSGEEYQGNYINGKRNGNGTMKWPNGNTYIGDWLNGKPHGNGIFTS